MMDDIDFTGFIDEHGRLKITNDAHLKASIACYPNTPIIGKISPFRNRITHNQRKYFFGVIVNALYAFFNSTGNEVTKADVYDFLKERFLFREKMCPISHRFIRVYISLSDKEGSMTREEFTEKKEAIQRWGAETLRLDLPDPDPAWRMYKQSKDEDRVTKQS